MKFPHSLPYQNMQLETHFQPSFSTNTTSYIKALPISATSPQGNEEVKWRIMSQEKWSVSSPLHHRDADNYLTKEIPSKVLIGHIWYY